MCVCRGPVALGMRNHGHLSGGRALGRPMEGAGLAFLYCPSPQKSGAGSGTPVGQSWSSQFWGQGSRQTHPRQWIPFPPPRLTFLTLELGATWGYPPPPLLLLLLRVTRCTKTHVTKCTVVTL